MSNKPQTGSSYQAIDAAKFIMAIFVVMIHTNPLYGYDNHVIQTIYSCLLHSAVPFFFLCTGFFLVRIADTTGSDLHAVTRRNLLKQVKMYLLWHLLYFPLTIHHFSMYQYSVIRSVLVTLRSIFLVGQNFNADILWYLLSSIYALVFVAVLLKFRFRLRSIAFSGCFVFLLGILMEYFLRCPGPMPEALHTFQLILDVTIRNGRILTGFLYIPLGMLIAQEKPSLLSGLLFLFAGFIGNYHFNGTIGTFMLALQSVGTFIVVSNISLPASPAYPFLRKSSTNLYFLHQYVAFLYGVLADRLHQPGYDVFFVTLAVSLLLSTLWIFVQPRLQKYKKQRSF